MTRSCAICGTPLASRKGHGYVTKAGVTCGRRKTLKTIKDDEHGPRLAIVNLPCGRIL